jgi:hypothetical protein
MPLVSMLIALRLYLMAIALADLRAELSLRQTSVCVCVCVVVRVGRRGVVGGWLCVCVCVCVWFLEHSLYKYGDSSKKTLAILPSIKMAVTSKGE